MDDSPARHPPPHRADLAFDPTDIALPVGLRRFGARLLDFQRKLEESRNPVVAAGYWIPRGRGRARGGVSAASLL